MMKRPLYLLMLMTGLALVPDSLRAGSAWTGASVREARVVSTEPISRTSEHFRCTGARPAGRDLVAMLAWDLCEDEFGEVRRTDDIVGYRVRYEFDGRTFTSVLDEPPGSVLPVRVRID